LGGRVDSSAELRGACSSGWKPVDSSSEPSPRSWSDESPGRQEQIKKTAVINIVFFFKEETSRENKSKPATHLPFLMYFILYW
jgi:hypothetical protein